jgi:hypothetical protein
MLSAHPHLTNAEITKILGATSVRRGPTRNRTYGYGVLNAYGATQAALRMKQGESLEHALQTMRVDSQSLHSQGLVALKQAVDQRSQSELEKAGQMLRRAYFMDPNNLERKQSLYLFQKHFGFSKEAEALGFELFSETGDFDWLRNVPFSVRLKMLKDIAAIPEWSSEVAKKIRPEQMLSSLDKDGLNILESAMQDREIDFNVIGLLAHQLTPNQMMGVQKAGGQSIFEKAMSVKGVSHKCVLKLIENLQPKDWSQLVDEKGRTPLHLGKTEGLTNFRPVKEIVQHFKLTPDQISKSVDKAGETPLQVARRTDDIISVMFLEDMGVSN